MGYKRFKMNRQSGSLLDPMILSRNLLLQKQITEKDQFDRRNCGQNEQVSGQENYFSAVIMTYDEIHRPLDKPFLNVIVKMLMTNTSQKYIMECNRDVNQCHCQVEL